MEQMTGNKTIGLTISVVTVCYNAVETLEETMLSVLNQTYPNVEYIVIDGGSTDGTVDIINKYADKLAYWVSEPDKGIYDAMNKGIAIATGNYINFMNAGDKYECFTSLSSFVDNILGDADIVFGNTIYKFKSNQFIRKALPLSSLRTKPAFCHQSTLIRQKYHTEHLYDVAYRIGADYNFMYLSYYNWDARFQYIDKTLAIFNCAEGTSTDNLSEAMNEKFLIWGIENDWFQKIPWKVSLMRSIISHKFKQILPSKIVVAIKKIMDATRTHIN